MLLSHFLTEWTVDTSLLVAVGKASWITAWFVVLLAGLYSFWITVWRPHLERKKPFEHLPMAIRAHWFVGHIGIFRPDFAASYQEIFVNAADQYGRTGFWLANRKCVSVLHWKDAKAVLQGEYYRKPERILGKHMSRILGPNNMLLLNGKEWRYHRSAVLKAFTPDAMAQARVAMQQVVNTVTNTLKARIAEAPQHTFVMDVESLAKMIALDIFGLAAFSHSFGCCDSLTPPAIAQAFDYLGQDFVQRLGSNPIHPLNYFYSLPTTANHRNNEADRLLRGFLKKMLQERTELLKSDKDGETMRKNKDLLTLLVEGHQVARDELQYKSEVSQKTLSDIMMTLLFAGYDTTSIMMSYAFYTMSQLPEIEANCLEEIRRVAQSSNGDLTNTYKELKYCLAVLYETLRIYPPAPLTNRTLTKPMQLQGGFVVPAGANVTVPIWSIHRQEFNFPRPLEFLPERWVKRDKTSDGTTVWVDRGGDNDETESGVPAANRDAFFAFSAGGRNCAGSKFAWQEASLVFAGMLREFKFFAQPGYELKPRRNGIVQHPDGGIPMKIQLRNATAL